MSDDNYQNSSGDDGSVTYTLRNISSQLDQTITSLAASAGKPKATYLREALTEVYSDYVQNFIRKNNLVASLDADIVECINAGLDNMHGYAGLSPAVGQGYLDILGVRNDDGLVQILLNNAPYLRSLAREGLSGIKQFRKGISLELALFSELAGCDKNTVDFAWENLFYSPQPDAENKFRLDLDCAREVRKLEPYIPAKLHFDTHIHIRSYQPSGYASNVWRIRVKVKNFQPSAAFQPVPFVPQNCLLIPDPGYTGVAERKNGSCLGYKFRDQICELHAYCFDSSLLNPADIMADILLKDIEFDLI